jgi:methyl-accepting chemotaxis protein
MFNRWNDRLNQVYKDDSVVIRAKAPGTAAVLLLICVLVPVIMLTDILVGDYVNAGFEAVIELIMAYALFQLFRGRYRQASIAPAVVATGAIAVLSFLLPVSSYFQVYTVALYMSAPLILTLVVSESEWFTASAGLIGLGVIVGTAYLHFAPQLPLEEASSITEAAVITGAIYLLVSFFALRVARSTRVSLREMEASNRKNEEIIAGVTDVMRAAESNVDVHRSIENDYRLVSEESETIQTQLNLFSERMKILVQNAERAIASNRSTAEQAIGFHEQVDGQNTVVEETTSAMNEMSASLDSVANITATRKDSAEELLSVAELGMEELQETNSAFDDAAHEMNSLLEINTIVSDIAARTNMLSMNAAIEAAHAGESGRGFAVVAEEIRKLAESAAANSRTIDESVKRLMESMERTRGHAQSTMKSMSRIVEETRGFLDAFAEIAASSSELSKGGREVLLAMQSLQDVSVKVRDGSDAISKEQNAARTEMESIGRVVDELGTAKNQISDGVEKIGIAMTHLHQTIGNAISQAERLNASVGELVSNR